MISLAQVAEDFFQTIQAPTQRTAKSQPRWFYERARGQYADAVNREGTPAKMKSWQERHPKNQMFTKTDLAKFENVWAQKPHTVSKGAQTNFAEFTLGLELRPDFTPSERYFQHLVARAILFRRAEKIVSDQRFGGYRANIVAYTLAYIAFKTAQRLDLDAIWKKQKISEGLEQAIEQICHRVHDHITTASSGANITQFCKQKKCWKLLKEKEWALSSGLLDELIPLGPNTKVEVQTGDALSAPSLVDQDNISKINAIEADSWFAASNWAKNTNNLQPWQRSLLFSIGRLRSSGREVSAKQAAQALKAIEQAKGIGWSV